MSTPRLSILIPATPKRYHTHLWPLWQKIEQQVAECAPAGAVEILVFLDNRARTIGEKRHALVQMSRGDFVAFCDDDDDVSPDYVSRLLQAIQYHPQVSVITFQQLAVINGAEGLCTFGLTNPNEGWKREGFRRSAWHVCAWLGALARRFPFPATNYGEDWAWARHLVAEACDRLQKEDLATVEHHIPAILHTYRYDVAVSEAPPSAKDPSDQSAPSDTSEITIPGWFDFAELYDQAVEHFPSGSVFVEIGTFLGKSAAYMLGAIAESGKAIHFTTYDTFTGSPTETEQQQAAAFYGGDFYAAAKAYLDAASPGADWSACAVRSDSVAAANNYPDGVVDFCFIDGDHTREGVARDIAAWHPKMKPRGLIAGHDIDSEAVLEAVEAAFGKRYRIVGRCWVAPVT